MLPLGVASEANVHYFCYFLSFLFFYTPHTFLPEGVVLGLWSFALSFKSNATLDTAHVRPSVLPSVYFLDRKMGHPTAHVRPSVLPSVYFLDRKV